MQVLQLCCFGRGFPRESPALLWMPSWQSGAKKYHKVTVYNKPHTRDLLRGKSTGEWLPLLRWEQRLYIAFLGGVGDWGFLGGLGLEGLCGLNTGASSGIGALFNFRVRLGHFIALSVYRVYKGSLWFWVGVKIQAGSLGPFCPLSSPQPQVER